MPIPRRLVRALSAVVMLSDLSGSSELMAGAESPRPSAATSTSPVGNPQATQPVAAWDVVPFQVFDKPFHVGELPPATEAEVQAALHTDDGYVSPRVRQVSLEWRQ